MSEDLKDIIERKIWTVDELVRQVTRLSNDAKKLPGEAKKNLPIFPEDWSEEKLRNYIEGLKNATKNPIRHKNRSLLEEIGLNTKGIQNEVLDDSAGIENIIQLYGELKRSNEKFARFVVEKENLSRWLKEGLEKAEIKLTELVDAEPAFSRIFECGIDEHLINELIQKCIEDSESIDPAEGLISKVKFVNKFDICTEYDDSFDVYCESVDSVYQIIIKLQDEFKIPKEEISQLVKGKAVDKAKGLLNDKLQDYSRQRDRLLEEWRIYSTALKSLGGKVSEQPQGFYKLREGTKKLKQACREALGGQGMRLIQFLKGEDNFPKKISKNEIERTLGILRPLFKGALREEI